jgi:predicted RNA-binding protein YlxR (DUF448 family)
MMSGRMMKTSSGHKIAKKPVPQRTCVACRQVKAKRDLIRVVRTPEGRIDIDDTGKKEGRGAYVCPVPECMEKALNSDRLEHTLKSRISVEESEKLGEYFRSLSEGTD